MRRLDIAFGLVILGLVAMQLWTSQQQEVHAVLISSLQDIVIKAAW